MAYSGMNRTALNDEREADDENIQVGIGIVEQTTKQHVQDCVSW